MANRLYKQFTNTLEAGIVKLYGTATTTTSGAIGSSSAKGFTIAKTAAEAGRYTLTLADSYIGLLSLSAVVEGAADTAYTTTAGLVAFVRSVDVVTNKVILLQFADKAFADAELEDAAKFYVEITLKNSTAY